MNPYLWLAVRIAFIAYWAISGLRGGLMSFPAPIDYLLLAFVWGCLFVRFFVMREYMKDGRTEPWLLPSWFVNPLQARQPFLFLHVAAVSFVVYGLCSALRIWRENPSALGASVPVELSAGALGLGMLLGLQWAVLAYRAKFEQVERRKA